MTDLNYDTHVTEYSVVDFDCDGNYEIVASIQYAPEPYYYFFIVLHYNGQDVYGYFYGVRQMSELKKDGSFSGSSGAVSQGYCRLSFENDMRNEECIAIKDGYLGYYELYGQECSYGEVMAFITDWNLLESVEWVKWNP